MARHEFLLTWIGRTSLSVYCGYPEMVAMVVWLRGEERERLHLHTVNVHECSRVKKITY